MSLPGLASRRGRPLLLDRQQDPSSVHRRLRPRSASAAQFRECAKNGPGARSSAGGSSAQRSAPASRQMPAAQASAARRRCRGHRRGHRPRRSMRSRDERQRRQTTCCASPIASLPSACVGGMWSLPTRPPVSRRLDRRRHGRRPRSRALSLDELAQLFERVRETPSFGAANAIALEAAARPLRPQRRTAGRSVG